jgi:hypothetical protein
MQDPNAGLTRTLGNISKLYPNPASDRLAVQFATAYYGPVDLYDNMGRLLLHTTAQGSSLEVNVESLTAGMYVLRTSQGTANFNISK